MLVATTILPNNKAMVIATMTDAGVLVQCQFQQYGGGIETNNITIGKDLIVPIIQVLTDLQKQVANDKF